MPTTYKVLGQTTATAAAATETLNLIIDPSYEGASLNVGPATTAGTLYAITGSPWKYTANDTQNVYVYYNPTSDISGTIIPYTGSKAISFYCSTNVNMPDQYMVLGTNSTTADCNTSTAIAVTPSATYYFGAFMYCHGSTVTTKNGSTYLNVRWFNNTTLISSNSLTLTKTGSSFTRTTSTALAPATANFAVITIFNSFSSTASGFANIVDGIHFSAVSGTNTTYPDNAQSSNITLTSPYTGRLKWNWTGTANTSTTFSSYAGAMTDVYTVPAASSAVVSTLMVSNLSTSATTFRVAVLPSGQTIANKNLILFDTPIGANSSDAITIGMTLAAGDKIQISSEIATVTATAFGSES